MVVHVTTQGTRIVREGRHLLVKKDDDVYHTLFTHKLTQLALYGAVNVTSNALSFLLREGIDVVFLRRDGRYLGRLSPVEPKNVFLRKRQFDLVDDAAFRLRLAKGFVRGKLVNMAVLLRRVKRARGAQETAEAVDGILKLVDSVLAAGDLDELRGLEGAASAAYFKALRYGFEPDQGFRRRVRRPPTDPVNAVLSFLYTLLINRAYAAVRLAGLDPYPGALHELDYGRHSLPLDLVEEFRPVVADALTLSLFNLRVLRPQDFHIEPTPSPAVPDSDLVDAAVADSLSAMRLPDDGEFFDLPEQRMNEPVVEAGDGKRPVRLTPEALGRVVQAFEKKMASELHHPVAGERLSFAEAMVFQARQVRRIIEGEQDEYQPLLLR